MQRFECTSTTKTPVHPPIALSVALLSLALTIPGSIAAATVCNGSPHLCARRYDQVSYATTHNAFNYAYGPTQFWFPNQQVDIPHQLRGGVRGLMIDAHEYNGHDPTLAGKVCVCHQFCDLGAEPLTDVLRSIREFLDTYSREVVTIIFESYVTVDRMEQAFIDSGLIDYAYPQPVGAPWPTLGEMIDQNRRLVVFTDRDGGLRDWYLDVWDFAVETDYSARSPEDLTCDYNRGDPSNSLFILNHFLTWPLARRSLAAQVNYNPFLVNRAYQCWNETGKRPNFVTVDFYLIGDLLETVEQLNAEE